VKLVSFLAVQEILRRSVRICCQGVAYLTIRIRLFLCFQKVLKYADKNAIEFQSSRKNILLKIHGNIFILKSSILKCFYHDSQLLLHDPSDLATTFTACIRFCELLNTFSQGGVILLRDLSRHQSGRSNSTPRFS
jgi:hypothetical protein